MDIVISNTSDKPIYRQLFEQISAQIIKGQLSGGEGLPPIRTVAKELRISIITVKKAWEE
ncbi:MAG: GntR family transcriptional regulator, partial [Clostridia bacterium]|nr:GntR family transcriptional regulator [Clostridia bacterium]